MTNKVEGLREKAFSIVQHTGNVEDGWTVGHWSIVEDRVRQEVLIHPLGMAMVVVRLSDAEAAIEAAREQGAVEEREAACSLIRKMCQGCGGSEIVQGRCPEGEECEYCGRVIAAIRARGLES